MPNFNLEEYELVEDRLKAFWKENPNGNINTEVVHITDDGTCVTIKATVYIFNEDESIVAVSTGIAQETKGQGGFANKDAWVENCETSAIGRALANWKYQGSNKRPSREEMSKTQSAEKVTESKPAPTYQEKKADVPSTPNASAESPVEQIKDAGFGDRKTDKHPTGEPALNDKGLQCICGARVNYIKAEEKKSPKSPDFRCSAMGQCTAGDTVDGKVFAKSWWMDNKQTPESWKDFAAVQNGIKLPDVKTLDDGDLPF